MARPKSSPTTETLVRALPVLSVIVAMAYLFAAYVLLFRPAIARLVPGGSLAAGGDEAYLAALADYDRRLDATIAGFGTLHGDHKDRVSKMVTQEPAIHDLFVQTDAIAARHALVLVSIDAVPDDRKATVAGRHAVRVSANLAGGTYAQFKEFLAEMETALRISDVQSVVFTSGGGSFSIAFKAYFIDPKAALGDKAAAVPAGAR